MAASQRQTSPQQAAATAPAQPTWPSEQSRQNSAAKDSVQPTNSTDSSLPSDSDGHAHFAQDSKEEKSSSHRILDHFKFSRATTDLRHVPTDESVNSHRYVIRRPRVLQVRYNNRIVPAGDQGILDVEHAKRTLEQTSRERANSLASDEPERRTTDFLDVQRDRVELFIDLLFVGIITNLSEHFFIKAFSGESSISAAVCEFILLFLPTWRIFWELQVFMSCYFMDDMLQRIVILAVIVLSLIWGNNAPFFLGYYNSIETQAASNYTIATYLVATCLLKLLEVIYSAWIPWMRRLMLVGWIVSIPSTALWVAIILTPGWPQISLLITVLCFDYSANVFLRSPFSDWLYGGSMHLRKALDLVHTRKRYEQFFTIALGEGVILLLRNSPLGQGWGHAVGSGIQVILIYFLLHWLYFNGAQSKSLVHALHRRWFFGTIWYFAHVVMYASMLIMSTSMLGLIQYSLFISAGEGESASPEGSAVEVPSAEGTAASESHSAATRMMLMRRAEGGEQTPLVDSHTKFRVAAVTACASLATTLFMTLIIALVNRPLDPPQTLRVNQRLIRLAPRAAAVALFACIWLVDFDEPVELLGVIASAMAIVNGWEWACALERDWSWVQTK